MFMIKAVIFDMYETLITLSESGILEKCNCYSDKLYIMWIVKKYCRYYSGEFKEY